MNFLDDALKIRDQIVRWRRDFHQIPEVDLDIPQTKSYIKNELMEMGISVQEYEKHSGMTAVIGRGGNKTVGIRADMDALPVREESGLAYASDTGKMHACGHDAHAAALLGTALILKKHEDELPGKVKLIFQPGEENLIGAKAMIGDGVLEHPHVDVLLAMHVGNLGGMADNGDIIVGKKNVFYASETIEIEIAGRGGHASTPHLTVDPIVIAGQILEGLQSIVSREIQPGVPAIISITNISGGLGTYNVIPDRVKMMGGIRARDRETQEFLFRRVREVVEGVSASKGAVGTFKRIQGTPPLVNDAGVVDSFLASAGKILPQQSIHEMVQINMGAEDAAYLFEKVPGCYFFLCNAMPCDGVVYPHHNGKFQIDDTILYRGTALMAQAAYDLVNVAG